MYVPGCMGFQGARDLDQLRIRRPSLSERTKDQLHSADYVALMNRHLSFHLKLLVIVLGCGGRTVQSAYFGLLPKLNSWIQSNIIIGGAISRAEYNR